MDDVAKQIQGFVVSLGVAVDVALANDVAEIVKILVSASVQKNVYDAYDEIRTTEGYERRGRNNGGLADTDNYDTWVENEHTLVLENTTTGNPAYKRYDRGNIVEIIESGKGYNWSKSDIYKWQMPRPFMDEALEGKHAVDYTENTLCAVLRKMGYNAERS